VNCSQNGLLSIHTYQAMPAPSGVTTGQSCDGRPLHVESYSLLSQAGSSTLCELNGLRYDLCGNVGAICAIY